MRRVVLKLVSSFPLALLLLLNEAVSGCGDIGGSFTTLLRPEAGLDLGLSISKAGCLSV